MAKFKLELPNELIKELEQLNKDTPTMMEEMTQAGAKVVYNNVMFNLPNSWRNSNIKKCIRTTKAYKMPSIPAIASQVRIDGYFINKEGKKTPAPMIANFFEYGTSNRKYPRQPFFRKSFNKKHIEQAMEVVQLHYLPKE